MGVTPALDLTANGSDIGYLYSGYFSSCREEYGELHITNSAIAGTVASAEVYIVNDATGQPYAGSDNTTIDVNTNGGWADSYFIPVDEAYYDALPVVYISFDQTHSCEGWGWDHNFSNGNNTWELDSGQYGNCSNTL